MTDRLAQCRGCLKFNKEENKCLVFTEIFNDWKEGECWARETDPIEWDKTLQQLEEYNNCIGKTHTHKRWLKTLQEERKKLQKTLKKAITLEIMEAYEEDKHRGKGGGGEKADRTNKTFGPQQMKDNRFAHRRLNPKKYNGWYD